MTPGEYARPPDCKCGHGQREHKNGKRVTSCERLSCGCQEYRPQLEANLAMAEEFFISNHDKPPIDSSASDIRTMALLRHPEISDEEAWQCARFLAGRAQDAVELRGWLEMLGLVAYASADHNDRIAVASRLEYVRP